MPRAARILVLAGGVVLALAVLLLAGLWAVSRTETFQTLVRERLLAALRAALPGAAVDAGRTGGTLGRTLVVEGLRIAVEGRTVARVPRITVRYRVLPLLRGRLRLDRVTLAAPRLRAVREGGRWRLPAAPAAGEADGLVLDVRRLDVLDGRLAVALRDAEPPRRLAATRLALRASALLDAATTVRVASLRLVPRGIAVTPVEGSGQLRLGPRGILEATAVRVATARSRAALSGRVDPGTRVALHLALAPADAAEARALLPALALATEVTASVDAAGPWDAVDVRAAASFAQAGTVDVDGTVDLAAEPARYEARVEVRDLDPGAAVRDLPRGRLAGRVRLDGRGLAGVHRARGALALPAAAASFRARLAPGPPADWAGSVRLRVARLEALVPALPGRAALRAEVEGRGFAAPKRRAALRATLTEGEVRGLTLTRGALAAALEGERLTIARAELEGPALLLTAGGGAHLAERTVDLDLEAAADLGGLAPPFGGALGVEARARGSLDGLGVEATVRGRALAAAALRAEEATIALDLAGLGSAAPRGRARVRAEGLVAGPLPARALEGAAEWRRAAGRDRLELTAETRVGEEPADALVLALERTPGRVAGELRTLALRLTGAGPRWQLARPAAFVAAGRALETPGLHLVAGRQALRLSGRLAAEGPSDLALAVARVRLADLCALADGSPCAGRLTGEARVRGTAAAPRLDAAFEAAGVEVAEVAYGTVRLEASYAERRAVLRARLDHPQAGALHLTGTVPVDLAWAGPRRDLGGAPVDLRLLARNLDLTLLRALAPRDLRRTAGRANLDLALTGARAAPDLAGEAAVDAEALELTAAGLPYREIRLRLAAAGRTLRVTRLTARAGDGRLEGSGSIRVEALDAVHLDLRVQLQEFLAVRQPSHEAAVSGTLDVGGRLTAPEVAGRLDVVRAVLRPTTLPGATPELREDPTITVVGRPAEPRPPPPPPEADLFDPLALRVEVRMARNVWIRRTDANIELGGAVRVEKAAYGPVRLSGRIRLLRGWYAFQGRRFEIDEGRITFTGAQPPDPTLDITAVHRTAAYRVIVRVGGTVSAPALDLSSEPPLEEADILSVLLFGRPTAELGRGQASGLQRQALQLAAGYVMPELRTSVMNVLGLDTLEVELPEGEDEPGRVQVGRYVTGDIFLSLAQEFGARAAEVVSVEYSLTRSIAVRGSTSTRGDSALDLFWHRRY